MGSSKIDLNLTEVFTEFFKLKDWKSRSLYLGGFAFFMVLLMGVLYFLFILSDMVGDPIFVFALFLQVIFIGLVFISGMYMLGYQIDLAIAFRDNRPIEEVGYLANYLDRLKNGLKLFFCMFLYFFTWYIVFIGGFYLGIYAFTMKTDFVIVVLLVTMLMLVIGFAMLFFSQIVLFPLLTARYVNTKSITSTINFREIWNDLKNYTTDLVLIGLVIYAAQTMFIFALYFSGLLVLLCVGLILFPVVIAVGSVYLLHFQARLEGNLARSLNSKP